MALDCPRCKEVLLDEIELGEIPVDRCPRCAGIWFDNAEVGEITGMRSKLQDFESIVPSSDFTETAMRCPRCEGVALRRLKVKGNGRQRTLYRCVSCVGTWLDRGELKELEDPTLVATLKSYFSEFD